MPAIPSPVLGLLVCRVIERVEKVLALQMEMWSVKLVLDTKYSMGAQFTECGDQCTVSIVWCTGHSVLSTVYSVQLALYRS